MQQVPALYFSDLFDPKLSDTLPNHPLYHWHQVEVEMKDCWKLLGQPVRFVQRDAVLNKVERQNSVLKGCSL